MRRRRIELSIFLGSLALLSGVAATLENPGSLDACYHLHVAQNLAAGRGMVEDLIWNYLDKSQAALALPRPSHLYWMPLTSWLAYLGIASFGALLAPFRAAQVPFVLLASLIPLLAYRIALALGQNQGRALASALLCLVAPNYLQVWVVPEPVTPFCLLSAAAFFACARARRGTNLCWILAGLGAGAAHLTHANGALVLTAAALAAVLPRAIGHGQRLYALSLLSLGYLSVMMPWFARNLGVLGAPLSSSVASTAWLRSYDEIFSYAIDLTPARWLASGDASTLLASRAAAAVRVLSQLLAIFQGVLPLFALLGWLGLAREQRARLAPCALYAGLLSFTMSFVFPFPAEYGSFFRGASALVPWLTALVPAGIARAASAYAHFRRRPEETVHAVFRHATLGVAVAAAILFHVQRLSAVFPYAEHRWNDHLQHYVEIDAFLREQGAEGPVLVTDPPGFTLATGRPSIVLPSDGASAVRAAADHYGARWLVLEVDAPSVDATFRWGAPLPGFRSVKRFRDDMGNPVSLLVRTP